MTKPYVAAAIMLLLEENRLRLDDPVARYIPEFSKPRRVRTLKPGSPPIPPFHGGPTDPDAPRPEYDYAPARRDLTVRDFLTSTPVRLTNFSRVREGASYKSTFLK